MKKLFLLILGIVMLMVCFAGCTSQPATSPTTQAPVATQLPVVTQPIASQSSIVGVWDLVSYNNGKGAIQTVIQGSQTTADFRADWKLSGSGGCNQYNAQYTTTASNGITITQPVTTLMACAEPVMQQETQYLSLLQQATKYEISGDQLTLSDKNGTKILIYKKHVNISTITGTWTLFSYNNGKGGIQTVLSGTQTTADFRAGGKLSGSGGCNQYSAEYTTTAPNGITITQPITTLMACAEPIMQQETQYLSLLQQATKYEISGDQLTLSDKNKTKLLIYQKQAPPTIVGTWKLFSYNNGKGAIQTAITGSVTTAVFGADWNLSGSGGCNQYSAGYTTTAPNGITITQPTTTLMACENTLMQQETQYLSLLPTAAKYEISGDDLTLFNSTGTKILIYKSVAGLKVNPL
jgi:heat shock protein HslJ